MGQATVDLPDPLETPPPATAGGTDDLLAQLAGDEIDRLLADADAAPAPPPRRFTPAAPSNLVSQDRTVQAAPAPLAASPDSDVELAAALNSLLSETEEKLPSAKPDAIASGNADSMHLAGSIEEISAAELAEAETSSRERDALHPDFPATEDAALDSLPTDDSDDNSLPFYLLPLEWINAPLANTSESVREAIGKIAILTLFNAAAVLIYVLFIRRG